MSIFDRDCSNWTVNQHRPYRSNTSDIIPLSDFYESDPHVCVYQQNMSETLFMFRIRYIKPNIR